MNYDKQVTWARNILAFSLVAAFVGGIVAFTFYAIPEGNRDTITYMVGQLSGMATMALGYYYVGKGQNSDKGSPDNPLSIEGSEDMIPVSTKENKK